VLLFGRHVHGFSDSFTEESIRCIDRLYCTGVVKLMFAVSFEIELKERSEGVTISMAVSTLSPQATIIISKWL
jgi:hypothetical protein